MAMVVSRVCVKAHGGTWCAKGLCDSFDFDEIIFVGYLRLGSLVSFEAKKIKKY